MAATGHRVPQHFDQTSTSNSNMSYPEPPHYPSAPMDHLGLSPEAYGAFAQPSHEFPSTMAFEGRAMYAESAPYMYASKSSPGMYPEDTDARGPASDLSIASASSSNMGSPLSSHGQMAQMPEWATAPHGLGVTPGIVDQNDYFPGGDYPSYTHGAVDGYGTAFDFAAGGKAHGYVGELAQIPRSSRLSPSLGPRPRGLFHHPAHMSRGSVSSQTSLDSQSTVVPASKCGLAVDTRLAQSSLLVSPVSASTTTTSASSAASSLVFASPATSTSSFSSPPLPAWSSPPLGSSPQPATPRLVPPFFSQSSGHFVPPLDSSYPSILHPDVRIMPGGYEPSYPAPPSAYPVSPSLSSASPQMRTGSTSPFMQNGSYPPFSPFHPPMDGQRRPSMFSANSAEQAYSGDEAKEKQRCPHPDCGKTFKDLKAHMLTHQTERPEKCPITTCEYHVKGFARKYDKNRHTLTHYKGTMVCGFCPGSGSAAEKSFNRADVFKRHLTAVHGVEQTPPNSRKKAGGATASNKKPTGYAPDATGKCSTCMQTFSNAQDFYEHLDDCVLRIVQQEDPAEAINAQRLAEVENDRDVHNTLEKNNLPTTTMTTSVEEGEDEDADMMDEDDEDDESKAASRGGLKSPTKKKGGNPAGGVQKSRGLTHSRGGVPLTTKTRGRKNRRDYPSSWGFDKGQMTMKKRVMAVFDGPRRLAKDDMMLSTEQEVRLKLNDGKSYITDLDMQTLKRAQGFLDATPEEKGPWISDDPTEEQLKQMYELSATPEMVGQQ